MKVKIRMKTCTYGYLRTLKAVLCRQTRHIRLSNETHTHTSAHTHRRTHKGLRNIYVHTHNEKTGKERKLAKRYEILANNNEIILMNS